MGWSFGSMASPKKRSADLNRPHAVHGQFFPPAFQAAAWCHFERNHLSDGLRSLRQFAEQLRTEEVSKLNLEDRLDLYEWLGEMHGCANRLDEAGEQRDALPVVETACRFEDDPVPAQRFEQGRQCVEPIFTKSAALVQRPEEEIRTELDPQLEKLRQELDQVVAEMAEAIPELKQVKQTAREAEIHNNRGNQNLKRVTVRYHE